MPDTFILHAMRRNRTANVVATIALCAEQTLTWRFQTRSSQCFKHLDEQPSCAIEECSKERKPKAEDESKKTAKSKME